jgi:hypothetical protein
MFMVAGWPILRESDRECLAFHYPQHNHAQLNDAESLRGV